jgi:hypothetical protein
MVGGTVGVADHRAPGGMKEATTDPGRRVKMP